jgi:hypothetical protein
LWCSWIASIRRCSSNASARNFSSAINFSCCSFSSYYFLMRSSTS